MITQRSTMPPKSGQPSSIRKCQDSFFFFMWGTFRLVSHFLSRRHVERRYLLLFLAEVACLDHPTFEAYLSRRWLG